MDLGRRLIGFAGVLACLPLVLAVAACATSLRPEPQDLARYKSIGLMVLASAQTMEDSDEVQRSLVRNTATPVAIARLQREGFSVRDLAPQLPQQLALDRFPGSFNINEWNVAEAAKKAEQSAALILFFSYAGAARPKGLDTTMYYTCTLYAWLLDAETADIKASARSSFLFKELGELELSKEQAMSIRSSYEAFVESMTHEILKEFGAQR